MAESSQAETLFIGQQLLRLKTVSSTNDFLKKKIGDVPSLAEGFAVVTSHQTSGRGQMGNRWNDTAGENLLTSIYLRPDWLPATLFFQLNMSVCLAVVQTLNDFTPGFQIKWPNDILYDRKKVAGLLIENSISRNRLSQSVVGIGINVNQRFFSAELSKASSLSNLIGHKVDLDYLLRRLFEEIEACYLQLKSRAEIIRTNYFDHLLGYQQELDFLIDGQKKSALLMDVQQDGQLVLKVGSEIRKFQFKELEFIL